MPIFVALLALRFDHAERATGRRLVGLVVGLAGVIALVGIDVAGKPSTSCSARPPSCVAAFGYAVGPMVFKRKLVDLDPRAAMGVSLAVAVADARAGGADRPAGRGAAERRAARVGVLGLLCTAAAFVFMAVLVADVGPGRALVITYVTPVVAVALGVAVLGESPAPARSPACCSSSPAPGCRPTAASRA